MAQEKTRWWKLAWFGGAVLVVLLILLALKLDDLAIPTAATGVPSKIVTFADGAELEILGVSVGERVVEDQPARGLFSFFVMNKGSSTYFQGGNGPGLEVTRDRENGREVRFRVHSGSPGAMLMEVRLKGRDGMARKLPTCMTDREGVSEERRLGGTRTSAAFKPVDDSALKMTGAMNQAGLQLLIQHRDPQSGWIDLTGPFLFNEAWTDRYVMVLTAWQRNLPTLDFRAILDGGQVMEFSLPNPDFRKSPAPGAAKALPLVHRAGDYTLTLRQVERFSTPGNHPFAAVAMDLHYDGALIPGLSDGPLGFGESALRAEDEWGNVVNVRRDTIRKKTSFGALLPASSKRMTLNLQVQRTDNYPRYSNAGFTVLEGVVSADGLGVDFKPGPDAALFGIRTMPVCRIKPAKSWLHGEATKDWKELDYEISGENGNNELESIQKRIGEIGQWKFPLFSGESSESGGLGGPAGGGSGWGAGQFHFKMSFNRFFPPEMLRPSAKIRVGIHGPLKNDDLRFDLELPELVQPR